MPTYAYTCRDCGKATEAKQDFSDAALTVCPHCGGVLRKQYGTVGVSFSGSGFYRTDSRAEAGGTKSSGGDSSSTKKESGSGDSGSSSGDVKTASSDAKKPAASAPSTSSSPATSSGSASGS